MLVSVLFFLPPVGCFSGDSLVVIKEQSEPVTMRELQTGQHVQCVDHQDFMLPTTPKWCKVMNWVSDRQGFP